MRPARATALLLATTATLVAVDPLGVTTLGNPTVKACGPFITFPTFTGTSEPDDPLAFARGSLGVIQPRYRLRYLVAAWRVLEGRALAPRERDAYVPAPPASRRADAVGDWIAARDATPGVAPLTDRPVPQKLLTGDGRYVYITNCGDDAFVTATKTLADRRSRGRSGDALREWIAAQDMVFVNCGRPADQPPAIPAAHPQVADRVAHADRAYQIAAARFYAGQFAEAEGAFAAIAADPASPWRTLAPYLAARATVRQATLGGTPPHGDRASLERAERMLDAILAAPRQREIHERSRHLRQFVRSHLHPTEVLREVAAQLESAADPSNFQDRLADLDYLMRWRFASLPDLEDPADAAAGPLLEWLAAVGGRWDDPSPVLSRWRTTSSQAWLVAVMMALPHDAAGVEDVLSAAAAMDRQSAAYPTVAFHRARILLRQGRHTEARAVLSEALATPNLSPSNVNLLRGARFITARTLDEFVDDAMRSATGEVVDIDDQRQLARRPRRDASHVLDRDVLAVLNERMPVDALQRVAVHSSTPPNVRRELQQMIFVRQWLLGRPDGLRAALPALGREEPQLAAALQRLDTADDQRLLDETALLLLRTPGLRPYIAAWAFRDNWQHFPGSGGMTRLDGLRDNWWCPFGGPGGSYYTPNLRGAGAVPEPLDGLRADKAPLDPAFLSEPERQRAADEHARLAVRDSGSNEVAKRVLDWARRNPTDPRVAESLHRIVRGLKVGCSTDQTAALSRTAFELLHGRYGKTTWAARTPYWYR